VFHKDRWGTGEFYAGIVVLEGLARQLGGDVSGRRYTKGLDRERMSRIARVVAAAPTDKLRAAASALWSELYGEPLTEIVDAVRAE
jgi:hypothetical protein